MSIWPLNIYAIYLFVYCVIQTFRFEIRNLRYSGELTERHKTQKIISNPMNVL